MNVPNPSCFVLVIAATGCAAPAATPPAAAPEAADASRSDAPDRSTAAVAEAFIARLAADDFDGAAGMFHYRAKGPTEEQRAQQRREIRHFLFAVTAETGRITAHRPAGSAGEVLFGSIGSGTVAYWATHGEPVSLTYEIEVETDGTAYLQLGFSFVDGEVALRSVGYGLPSARPGAAERLQEIMNAGFGHPPGD